MTIMMLAALMFVGTHLGLSSTGLRSRLVASVGERGYLGLYSLLALGTLSGLIWLYSALPRYDYLWMPAPELYLTAKLIMPLALILAIGAFLVQNPTSVGAGSLLRKGAGQGLAKGVTRITRHPFQWGVMLWAVAHLVANGDTISVVFFSSFLVLSSVGSVMIDRKRAAALGDHWRDYARVTSNVPFLAILQGRNRLVAGELWQPVLAGLGAYGLLTWCHQWVGGVRIF